MDSQWTPSGLPVDSQWTTTRLSPDSQQTSNMSQFGELIWRAFLESQFLESNLRTALEADSILWGNQTPNRHPTNSY